jgi:hypothetical protein
LELDWGDASQLSADERKQLRVVVDMVEPLGFTPAVYVRQRMIGFTPAASAVALSSDQRTVCVSELRLHGMTSFQSYRTAPAPHIGTHNGPWLDLPPGDFDTERLPGVAVAPLLERHLERVRGVGARVVELDTVRDLIFDETSANLRRQIQRGIWRYVGE